jgi:hypothetical protein
MCLFFQEIRKVVKEIGAEHIVHIVTDNGSNYRKACKALGNEFAHITWTPCLAHTVNLMLKDISERAELFVFELSTHLCTTSIIVFGVVFLCITINH